MKRSWLFKTSAVAVGLSTLLSPLGSLAADDKDAAQIKTVKGEVVDLMCYLDHGAKGEKHKGCATGCISKGGPVGLVTQDDQVYLVVGDHKPINNELAAKAAQTVTLKGKVVERGGMKMIENAELEK